MNPCFECGQPAENDHHVVPLTRGGTKTVPLCPICHSKAHARVMPSRELIQEGRKKRAGRIVQAADLLRAGATYRQVAVALEMRLGHSLNSIVRSARDVLATEMRS